MRILIDIGHPAHVHYFRNLYQILSPHHKFIVTTKNVPIILNLLEHYGIPYVNIGNKGHGIAAKVLRQILFTLKIRQILIKEKIDIALGVSFAAVHASVFLKCKSIIFLDDDKSVLTATAPYTMPFIDSGLSPDSLKHEETPRVIYYTGYQELAYLHPQRFEPNPDILKKYGLSPEEKYYILRFNAFNAHHDVHEGGMDMPQKRQLIELLTQHGKVFITTEAQLDNEFEKFKLPIAPHEIHDFLFYAQMLVSDSQTMSSEAAMLGVPSFRCNSFVDRISTLKEEEKRYGLTYGFLPTEFDRMILVIRQHLQISNLKEVWMSKRDNMLSDKIDVTAFWVWFIENYPDSRKWVLDKNFNFCDYK